MVSANVKLGIIVALAGILYFAALSMLVFPIQPPLITSTTPPSATPTVSVTLYAGEISATKYGFGLSADNLTSPGPTLRFKTSDVVNLTLVNAGQIPHAFALTNAPKTGATILFNAAIASASNPIEPGQSSSVIFSPNVPSQTDYYICPVPGHAELGMYGSVIVTVG
ncbi:MAG: sulfocyanin-like copper-binding protein [Candidatus Bathyarchaeota archaeon]|nr:sulfocyanin-like copper-binding protein [Candidatus Bathyarchaeota archaeon]